MSEEKNDAPVTPEMAAPEATENTESTEAAQAPAQGGDKAQNDAKDGKKDRRDGNRRGRGRRENRGDRQPKEFEESIIQIDRVTRVTKGGRQLRFRVSVIIGDQKGRVGFGIGKSSEVMTGVQKAITQAKRNLITVPIFEDTIPHSVTAKFKSSKVFLLPAPEGKGVIAGGAVRKVLELAGIKNALSKIHGSRNKINTTYATIQALQMLQNRAPHKSAEEAEDTPKEEKAEAKAADKKPAKKAPAKKTTKKKDA